MLIEQIKKDRMDAKRAHKYTVDMYLTTLLSEVQRTQKRPSDVPTDVEVIKVITKCVKNLDEMISVSPDNPDFRNEQKLISKYLPPLLAVKRLNDEIHMIVHKNKYDNMKDMGKVMKALKEKWDGQYDGKEASQIVRKFLA